MFDRVEPFLTAWATESRTTAMVLASLRDRDLAFRPHPATRNIGELAWHIVTALYEIGSRAGLAVKGPGKNTAVPTSTEEIHRVYLDAAAALQDSVKQLSDARLVEAVEVYDQRWTRGWALYVLVNHEVHHRGQLILSLRIAGAEVPATYGPVGSRAH